MTDNVWSTADKGRFTNIGASNHSTNLIRVFKCRKVDLRMCWAVLIRVRCLNGAHKSRGVRSNVMFGRVVGLSNAQSDKGRLTDL